MKVVARECQHQTAQLSGADGAAAVSHLQGSCIDDRGTRGFTGLQNSVGFGLVFFFSYQSFVVAVNDFPASTFYILQIFLVLIVFL